MSGLRPARFEKRPPVRYMLDDNLPYLWCLVKGNKESPPPEQGSEAMPLNTLHYFIILTNS